MKINFVNTKTNKKEKNNWKKNYKKKKKKKKERNLNITFMTKLAIMMTPVTIMEMNVVIIITLQMSENETVPLKKIKKEMKINSQK